MQIHEDATLDNKEDEVTFRTINSTLSKASNSENVVVQFEAGKPQFMPLETVLSACVAHLMPKLPRTILEKKKKHEHILSFSLVFYSILLYVHAYMCLSTSSDGHVPLRVLMQVGRHSFIGLPSCEIDQRVLGFWLHTLFLKHVSNGEKP